MRTTIELKSISKYFGSVIALKNISIYFYFYCTEFSSPGLLLAVIWRWHADYFKDTF